MVHLENNNTVELINDYHDHTGSIKTLLIDKELDLLYTGSFDQSIKVIIFKFPSHLIKSKVWGLKRAK